MTAERDAGASSIDLVRPRGRPLGADAVHAAARSGRSWLAGLGVVGLGVVGLGVAGTGPLLARNAASVSTVPPSPGSLAVTARIGLGPTSLAGLDAMPDTEGPDGTFYFATGASVLAVRSAAAPAPVLHASGRVLALAATASDLYVQVGLTVSDYSLTARRVVRSWALTRPRFVPKVAPTSAGLLAAGSVLWSWTDWATDQSGFEYADVQEIETPAATIRPISMSAYPADMAADGTGLYYETTVGSSSRLAHVAPNGKTTLSGPTSDTDSPMVIAIGSLLLFTERQPSGTPYLDRFSTSSLAKQDSVRLRSLIFDGAETAVGLLTIACNEASCASHTISSISPLTAAVTASVSVPGLAALVPGIAPAALAFTAGHGYLVRLGKVVAHPNV